MTSPLILVADDSPDIRTYLQEAVLAPAGYQVRLAADGETALQLALETQPDLVITDHQMPRLSGLELTRKICAVQPHPPVIMMSSDRSDSLLLEAISAGAFEFLAKPFEPGLMLSAVGRALARQDEPRGRTPGPEAVTIRSTTADYAAIAIENARLFSSSEAERRKLETILARVENGVIVVDPEQRLLIMNLSAREALGVHGDWSGRTISEVVTDLRLLSMITGSPRLSKRQEIESDDGRVFSAQRTPIEGIGQAIVMQDITKLKELDRIKSEFVTAVSHDLRSPLTAILGYIELVERAGELNQQQVEFMRRVRLSVSQITDLVSNLLDLGRIEAGLDEAKELTPVAMLARYALESMGSAAAAKGLELHSELSDELPMVWGAPIRLRQMIDNLIDNAIKYTPAGGRIVVSAKPEGDQVILAVKDSGPGISTADQPYLFDRFFRGSNAPLESQGTGLGLSIVKSIVDNHGGRVWVDSQPGEGTTFKVVLPTATS